MSTTINEHSVQMLSYFLLQAAKEFETNPETFEDSLGFACLVVENLDAWLDKIDWNEYEDQNDIGVIKEDILRELREGNYLNNGTEAFLHQLASFLGDDYESRVFYRLVKHAVQVVESE